MNFLVDAQLPRRMTAWLTAAGCNAIHTLELPDANRTTDDIVREFASHSFLELGWSGIVIRG